MTPADQHALREALAREKLCDQLDHLSTIESPQACADAMDEARLMILSLATERDEAERGKAAALGLQNGGALIIRQLEAERDALTGQRDELQGLIVTAEICAERAIARARSAEDERAARAKSASRVCGSYAAENQRLHDRALAAEAENTRLKETVEAARAALEPFASSVTWGGWLSWLINGAPSRDQGKAAAKQLVHWQVAVDVVLATIPPKENPDA